MLIQDSSTTCRRICWITRKMYYVFVKTTEARTEWESGWAVTWVTSFVKRWSRRYTTNTSKHLAGPSSAHWLLATRLTFSVKRRVESIFGKRFVFRDNNSLIVKTFGIHSTRGFSQTILLFHQNSTMIGLTCRLFPFSILPTFIFIKALQSEFMCDCWLYVIPDLSFQQVCRCNAFQT